MAFLGVFLRELLLTVNNIFRVLCIPKARSHGHWTSTSIGLTGIVLLANCVVLGCATQSAVSGAPLPVIVREKLDSVAEAEAAQRQARAAIAQKDPNKALVEKAHSNQSTEKVDSGSLLRSLILNGDLASAASLASGLRSLKYPTPMTSLLLSLVDFQQGNRVSGRQRLKIVRQDFEHSRSVMAPKDAQEIEYLCEVVSALFEFALGQEAKGSASLAKAAEIAPAREEHFVVASLYHRSRGRTLLALRALRELFAVVETPSVESYLIKAGLEDASGLSDDKAVTLRRAEQQFPESLRIESYLAREEFLHGSPILGCAKFEKVYNVSRDDGDAAYNHAFCLIRSGSVDKATSVLEAAVLLHSSRSDLRTLLASLYLKSDRQTDADRLWRNFDSTESDGILENSNRFLMQSMDAGRAFEEAPVQKESEK